MTYRTARLCILQSLMLACKLYMLSPACGGSKSGEYSGSGASMSSSRIDSGRSRIIVRRLKMERGRSGQRTHLPTDSPGKRGGTHRSLVYKDHQRRLRTCITLWSRPVESTIFRCRPAAMAILSVVPW